MWVKVSLSRLARPHHVRALYLGQSTLYWSTDLSRQLLRQMPWWEEIMPPELSPLVRMSLCVCYEFICLSVPSDFWISVRLNMFAYTWSRSLPILQILLSCLPYIWRSFSSDWLLILHWSCLPVNTNWTHKRYDFPIHRNCTRCVWGDGWNPPALAWEHDRDHSYQDNPRCFASKQLIWQRFMSFFIFVTFFRVCFSLCKFCSIIWR